MMVASHRSLKLVLAALVTHNVTISQEMLQVGVNYQWDSVVCVTYVVKPPEILDQ
jgi:hypothetical protein